jgi:hypothetical protein
MRAIAAPMRPFISKYDSAGTYKWAQTFTSSGGTSATTVAIDSAGHVIVGGVFGGPTNFGGGTVTPLGDEDIFLAEFTSSGSYIWSKDFGVVSSYVSLRQVVFNSSGDIFIIGETEANQLDLGCGALPSGTSLFAAQLDSGGSCA